MGRRTVGEARRVTCRSQWRLVRQVVLPAGFEPAERQSEAVGGRERAARQVEPGLLRRAVLLLGVAAPAGRHHVLPRVGAAPRARDHVIQVLRRRGAVLARPFVTGEDRPTGERSVRTVGHANVAAEPDDGRRLHRDRRRAEHHAVRDDDLGLLLQDQHHGSARGNHREGRIGRVEHQGATHAAKSSLQPSLRAVRRVTNCPWRNESHACNLAKDTTGRLGRDAWSCEQGPRGASAGRAGPPFHVRQRFRPLPRILRSREPAVTPRRRQRGAVPPIQGTCHRFRP